MLYTLAVRFLLTCAELMCMLVLLNCVYVDGVVVFVLKGGVCHQRVNISDIVLSLFRLSTLDPNSETHRSHRFPF